MCARRGGLAGEDGGLRRCGGGCGGGVGDLLFVRDGMRVHAPSGYVWCGWGHEARYALGVVSVGVLS